MGAGAPRWLDEDEMTTWLALVQVVNLLPQVLDRQLREEAGLNHVYYQVLAILSGEPCGQLRMSELARRTAMSLSRLSHAVSTLESRGWVVRAASPDDRRGQLARLTDDGRALLREHAPGHLAEVRRRVFDKLTPQEVRDLGRLVGKLEEGLTSPASDRGSGCAAS
jgi:DNA-binding MarR family transcriptional regulator